MQVLYFTWNQNKQNSKCLLIPAQLWKDRSSVKWYDNYVKLTNSILDQAINFYDTPFCLVLIEECQFQQETWTVPKFKTN